MVKSKNAHIVLGLNYGDEGKGLTTDYLSLTNKKSIVIRFNGGHQAGHTVNTEAGECHVFSSFGSGTLRGVPTFWSSYCTFSPAYFLEELETLEDIPVIYIDRNCKITTHYDVIYNRAIETTRAENRHGSCGVGFGSTIKRNSFPNFQFTFDELLQSESYSTKLTIIREYYRDKINNETKYDFDSFNHSLEDLRFAKFIMSIKELIKIKKIVVVDEYEIFSSKYDWNNYIFEGAQGILLDKDFGQKPNITKSNTVSKNALEIISRQKNLKFNISIYYVTRAYLTRHGAGLFRKREIDLKLINNENETNIYNTYQGEFKIGYLDEDLLNYSLMCDKSFHKKIKIKKNLVITCLDQVSANNMFIYKKGRRKVLDYKNLAVQLNCEFHNVYYSFSDCSVNLLNKLKL